MSLPLLLTALRCIYATATPVTACDVRGVAMAPFHTTILTVGGAARHVAVRPEPPPTLTSLSISDWPTTSTSTTATVEIPTDVCYLTMLRAGSTPSG